MSTKGLKKSTRIQATKTAKPTIRPKAAIKVEGSAQSRMSSSNGVQNKEILKFVEDLKRQWLETIDAIPDPFLVVSDDYSIIKANVAMSEVAGTTIKNIVNKKCYEVFASRKSPCENCRMKNATDGETMPGYEIYNAKNDRWYEVATRRLQSLSGQKSVVQIYRDRTDAKKLQNQMAQNEKLASIGQLAGGFAHEINNPLGGILVFSQMILREMKKTGKHYPDVVEIENAARRCKLIVENLLAYSRQRPIKPNLAPTDIHAVIESSLKLATLGQDKSTHCDAKLKLNAETHSIHSDQNRLTQVFINLFKNGFQAMPKGGVLTITTEEIVIRSNSFILVKIADSGTGIKQSNLSKIFEPFYTTKEPGQGTGLGLSIVHGIMQDLGGTIDVKSKIDHGTTFSLYFPLPEPKRAGRGKV